MTIFSARDDEDHLVIRPDKTNIANPDVAAMYSIRAAQQFEPTEDDDGRVAKLECFATSDRTISEWVADNYSETNSLDPVDRLNAEATAESWLRDYLLENHPRMDSAEVKADAKAADIALRTLQRARRRLGVVIEPAKGERPFRTCWGLP